MSSKSISFFNPILHNEKVEGKDPLLTFLETEYAKIVLNLM